MFARCLCTQHRRIILNMSWTLVWDRVSPDTHCHSTATVGANASRTFASYLLKAQHQWIELYFRYESNKFPVQVWCSARHCELYAYAVRLSNTFSFNMYTKSNMNLRKKISNIHTHTHSHIVLLTFQIQLSMQGVSVVFFSSYSPFYAPHSSQSRLSICIFIWWYAYLWR